MEIIDGQVARANTNNSTDISVPDNNTFWKKNVGEFYVWYYNNENTYHVLITNKKYITSVNDIIGKHSFDINNIENNIDVEFKKKISDEIINVKEIDNIEEQFQKYNFEIDEENNTLTIKEKNTPETSSYTYNLYAYNIKCNKTLPDIEFKGLIFMDVCEAFWEYLYNSNVGYVIDFAKLQFKSEILRNILINTGIKSIKEIIFYDNNIHFEYTFNQIEEDDNGNVKINGTTRFKTTRGRIENLRMDITIEDSIDVNYDSIALKNYFSVFDQLSMYKITESVNNNYNVKYYSTVEDNKYKIRIINPDSIEIKDLYEIYPVEITQNNKKVIGSVEIKEKNNIDDIGVKVINRYSGFYNPIFNDILYYDDYTDIKNKYKLPYSNTNINYEYSDEYGKFGVIKNLYFHKTNTNRSDNILTSEKPIYPAINEYALDYRDYNIFSSSWDEGYFITQDNINTYSICEGIGSMKEGLCMFGSKYLNLPDNIFIDTFMNGKIWDETYINNGKDNTDTEIMYKEINNKTVKYHLFIEKQLKRYLKESLMGVFEKYINKDYSFGNKGTIEDDVNDYVEKNLLTLYKIDKVYMYVKSETMNIHNKKIENEYLKYMEINNDKKIQKGFPIVINNDKKILKDYPFAMTKINEFDRTITYNLKPGYKESFGFGVSFKRK